ncbi:MAG: leucine-rich repeat protein [Bacteroides sp.]|nr:leucine-rich repeat protein [Bacteroides sp.]
MAFYDNNSWCNFKILTNSEEDGYTVEMTSSYLLDLAVPESVDYNGTTYTVVGIGTGAFKNKTLNIDKFSLPNTLEYIGEQAFYNTKFQTPNKTRTYSLSLPSAITTIGKEAFMNAYAHNEGRIAIYLPSSLKEIPYRCFFQANFQSVQVNKACTAIKDMAFCAFTGSISIPADNSINTIDGNPFYNSQLTNISLPLIESIGFSSFRNCSLLSSISIGDKISVIPSGFLSNCSYLSKVEFKGEIEEIGANAFQGCNRLKEFKFGDTVLQAVGDYAFDGCESLEYFEFPESLKSIGNYSFRGCKNFIDLYFPDGMESIGAGAFASVYIRRILLNGAIKNIGRGAFDSLVNAEWLLKSARPTEAFNSLLPLPYGVRIYIPHGCFPNYGYVTGWSLTELSEKDGFYKTLPTWRLANRSSIYGDPVEPELIYNPNEDLTGDEPIGAPIITSDYEEWRDAGSYPVKLSWDNTPHSRFIMLLEDNWLISKAELTAKATDASRAYGEPNPEIDIVYSGFKYDDNESMIEVRPSATIDATEDSPVGIYPITLSGGETQNYTFRYVEGELTIEKAPQNIIWNQEFEKVYADRDIELVAESSSGLHVSFESSDTSIAEVEGSVVRFKLPGVVTLKATQSGDENYLPAEPVEKIITVDEYSIVALRLNESEITIMEGEGFPLTATWEPADIASPDLTWASSNPECVTVDDTGMISGIKQGSAIVTVSLTDHPEIAASCAVNVDIESGVNELEDQPAYDYLIDGNKLIRTSEITSPISIYSVEGVILYQGTDKEIELNKGIHLLNVDGKTIKIKI